MLTVSPVRCRPSEEPHCFVAQVTLASGELAGEGGGPTVESAYFYAVKDALRSPVARFATAGCGHLCFLSESDQAQLAELADRARRGWEPF